MAIQGNLHQTKKRVETIMRAGETAMITGSPGLGKSAIVIALAEEFNLKLIDLRLSQCDPTDLLGFPVVDPKTGRADYAPMITFPLMGDSLPIKYDENGEVVMVDGVPKTYAGWLLFLDEMNGADRNTGKAAYKLLDRKVGQTQLHENVIMVGAGNRDTDGAFTEESSTALQSRLIHLEVISDHKCWQEWALTAGIDHRIRSFLRSRPSELNTFDPNKTETEQTFACERTWAKADSLLKVNDVDENFLPLLAGTVGEASARQFMVFNDNYNALPDIQDILKNPLSAKLPDKPGGRWAVSGILSENLESSEMDSIVTYMERLPKEFQVITLRDMFKKDPTILRLTPVANWVAENNTVLS